VAVWVGLKTDGSFRVMQFAENFGRTRLDSPKTVHRIKPSHLEPIADEAKAFFRRSYWTRVWIIQEIVAASQLRVLCGPDIVDWTPFSIFVSALPEQIHTTRSSMSLADASMAKKISQFRRDRVAGGSISMLQALHLSSLSDSTDPKDKVFALLGLSFDRMVYVAEPTYAWSELEICIRMTTSFFESKRSLDIVFLGPGNQTSSLGLPSWCPRYTKFASDPDLQYIISYVSGQDQKYRIGVKDRRWNTTGTRVISNTLLDSSNHLLLTAWPIGKVAALSRRHGGDPHHYDPRLREDLKPSDGRSSTNEALTRVLFLLYNDDYERHLHEIDGLVAWWRGQHGEHIARPEAFLSLLYNFDSDDLKREKLAYQFESIKRWRHLHRKFSINGKTLSSRCPRRAIGQKMSKSGVAPTSSNILSDIALTFLGANGPMNYHRSRLPTPDLKGSLSALSSIIDEGLRLMTTDRGDVGWAHRDAGIRDEIFLVSGCSMPMILRSASRESGGAYKVVGHAYVDGFMDGEAWSKARTRDMVDLRIC
jgi:hypothetical protein